MTNRVTAIRVEIQVSDIRRNLLALDIRVDSTTAPVLQKREFIEQDDFVNNFERIMKFATLEIIRAATEKEWERNLREILK